MLFYSNMDVLLDAICQTKSSDAVHPTWMQWLSGSGISYLIKVLQHWTVEHRLWPHRGGLDDAVVQRIKYNNDNSDNDNSNDNYIYIYIHIYIYIYIYIAKLQVFRGPIMTKIREARLQCESLWYVFQADWRLCLRSVGSTLRHIWNETSTSIRFFNHVLWIF